MCTKREYYFQADVAALVRNILPIAQRYRERAGIPAGAEIVDLSEADVPLEEIAGSSRANSTTARSPTSRTCAGRREDSADRSPDRAVRGEVVGVLLSRNRADTANAGSNA